MENLTVATALEIRRPGGSWILPTLETEPRVAKPPLAAWIAAASIRPSTFSHLDDTNFDRRNAAYRALAFDVRWTALLCSCLTLLAIFDLGRTIGSPPTGLTAMILAGSTLYLLRFGRQATTDVQLMLWVTVANAAIARLLLRGPSWRAAIATGIALGLALMSKGPVALLQTLLPAGVFAALARSTRISLAQVATALILMLLVGAGWYVYVFTHVPGVWARWKIELARTAPGEKSSNPFSYLSMVAYMLPWTAVLIHGLIWTTVETWRRKFNGWTLALLLVLVPILTMSFFPDRKERYLLPLVGPAAILAARGIAAMLDPLEKRKIPPIVNWAIVAVIGIGLPISGATHLLKRVDGAPWYPPVLAACAAVVVAMLIIIAIQQSRRYPFVLVIAPATIMLMLQPLFLFGYRDAREGVSEMRPLAQTIRYAAPDAVIYNWRPEGPKRADVSLSIYLNRPTVWVDDPSAIPRGERAQVMITQQRPDRPERLAPPDWIYLDQVAHDKERYMAFVRPPR